MISGQKIGAWIKSHSHHLIFAITLISLAALASWWSVFIRQAIDQQYKQQYDQIKSDVRWHAMMMGHDPDTQLKTGKVADCDHLEISNTARYEIPYSMELVPYFKGYYVQPVKTVIDEIEENLTSKKKMILGESTLLVMLIMVSCIMLYRLIWLERQAASELKAFWNRVTHEIKTPITGLKAFLQTLKSHQLDPADMARYIDLALAQVERQEQLADNLLVGQRLDRSRAEFNPVDLEIVEFVKTYFRDHALMLKDGQVDFRTADPMTVHCDPDALRVILNNLTENAVKFTGDNLVLTVSVTRDRQHIMMEIADNGPGFDPTKSKNIFDAYHRLTTDLPKGVHGTGMGLYVSRRLARKMGGDLQGFSNGPDQGARFVLRLKPAKES